MTQMIIHAQHVHIATSAEHIGALLDTRIDSAPAITPAAGHTKVLADGEHLPSDSIRTDHVAVIDHGTGLMWAVHSLGNRDDNDDTITQEQCIERCRDLRLLGFDDWRLPTRSELAALIDDTRPEPAINTNLFPGVKPAWHWTSTERAGSSASAWGVIFSYGLVFGYHRDSSGFALAVRAAGQ